MNLLPTTGYLSIESIDTFVSDNGIESAVVKYTNLTSSGKRSTFSIAHAEALRAANVLIPGGIEKVELAKKLTWTPKDDDGKSLKQRTDSFRFVVCLGSETIEEACAKQKVEAKAKPVAKIEENGIPVA